ncbi:metal-dependent phosphohydrolase [Artemisia annua]|uniref:Metal-dependent phosphohydrolase n=1 Tax=Artemisia annua TaxID=35608 RepID=A0A2U1PXD1_ARTAN|nr:metal-dependent phosphohydrolase [Artemisia annua]
MDHEWFLISMLLLLQVELAALLHDIGDYKYLRYLYHKHYFEGQAIHGELVIRVGDYVGLCDYIHAPFTQHKEIPVAIKKGVIQPNSEWTKILFDHSCCCYKILRLAWMDFQEALFIHRNGLIAIVASLDIIQWNFFRVRGHDLVIQRSHSYSLLFTFNLKVSVSMLWKSRSLTHFLCSSLMFTCLNSSKNNNSTNNKRKKTHFRGSCYHPLGLNFIGIVVEVKSRNSRSNNSNPDSKGHKIVKSSCSSTFYLELCYFTITSHPEVSTKASERMTPKKSLKQHVEDLKTLMSSAIFLKEHSDLLWLHEIFLHQFYSASETLHVMVSKRAAFIRKIKHRREYLLSYDHYYLKYSRRNDGESYGLNQFTEFIVGAASTLRAITSGAIGCRKGLSLGHISNYNVGMVGVPANTVEDFLIPNQSSNLRRFIPYYILSIHPHVSMVQRDKAASLETEEEQSRVAEKMGVVELAALLHDIGDYKYLRDPSEEKVVEEFLAKEGFKVEINGVANGSHIPEFGVVQDADRLDAIGAIGIDLGQAAFSWAPNNSSPTKELKVNNWASNLPTWRHIFSPIIGLVERPFGGSRNRVLHDPNIQPRFILLEDLGQAAFSWAPNNSSPTKELKVFMGKRTSAQSGYYNSEHQG